MVSLDLSAAFDTIDHGILLSRLETLFGISGIAHKWLSSYLADRSQSVYIDQSKSGTVLLYHAYVVFLKGRSLDPSLFTLYLTCWSYCW